MFQFDFLWWDKWKNRWSEHFQTIFAKSAGFDYCNMRKIPTWRRCNKKVDIRIAAKDTNFDFLSGQQYPYVQIFGPTF